MDSNSGGCAEKGVLMTYERRSFVLSIDLAFLRIRQDEMLRRKLAVLVICRPVSSFHHSGVV
jgi:hypothetical protein